MDSKAEVQAEKTTIYEPFQQIFGFLGDLGLAVFYASLLLFLSRVGVWEPLLSSFQWAGRMALTN
jgi:uncharacterized membrane protein YeiB